MNHIVFQSKCQGYSHIKSDLECQDSTLVKKTEKYAIAVVADGHDVHVERLDACCPGIRPDQTPEPASFTCYKAFVSWT